MDVQHDASGRKQFVLGPVELWIVGIVATLVVGGSAATINAYATRIDTLNANTTIMSTKLEVLTTQMQAMNTLIADVPNLRDRMSRVEARVDSTNDRLRMLEARK